jgi:hypothetical protein
MHNSVQLSKTGATDSNPNIRIFLWCCRWYCPKNCTAKHRSINDLAEFFDAGQGHQLGCSGLFPNRAETFTATFAFPNEGIEQMAGKNDGACANPK